MCARKTKLYPPRTDKATPQEHLAHLDQRVRDGAVELVERHRDPNVTLLHGTSSMRVHVFIQEQTRGREHGAPCKMLAECREKDASQKGNRTRQQSASFLATTSRISPLGASSPSSSSSPSAWHLRFSLRSPSSNSGISWWYMRTCLCPLLTFRPSRSFTLAAIARL